MTRRYNLKNIRALLTEGFTATQLRRLCYDDFRPVYDQLAEDTGKTEIIDRLLEHVERTLQLDKLLDLANELNPTRYENHQPYYFDFSTPPSTSSNSLEKVQRTESKENVGWDVFISHASEDKPFVRHLATALERKGLRVWFDEFTLRVGDNLRRSIDFGLASSRYGVVILSPSFFAKEWPQKELDGLITREVPTGEKVILPVWHNINNDQIRKYSVTLANRVAVSSAHGVEHVITELLRAMEVDTRHSRDSITSLPNKTQSWTPRLFLLIMGGLLAFLLLVSLVVVWLVDGNNQEPTPTSEQSTDKSASLGKNTAELVVGHIAFSSMQTGLPQIHVMKPDGSERDRLYNVSEGPGISLLTPAWSPDGTHIASSCKLGIDKEKLCLGNVYKSYEAFILMSEQPAKDSNPTWSPDGKHIAFASNRDDPNPANCKSECNYNIFIMNIDDIEMTRLTDDLKWDSQPAWSPDGIHIAFTSNRDGNMEIYTMNADGSGQMNLTNSPSDDQYPAWSSESTRITFTSNRDGNMEIYTMNADGSGQMNLTQNSTDDWYSTWSPNDMYIAFTSNRDFNENIYVMNTDGSMQTRLTDNAEWDAQPSWSLK